MEEYKKLKDNDDYLDYVEKIDNLKNYILPEEFVLLQKMLIDVSKSYSFLKDRNLIILENKISELEKDIDKSKKEFIKHYYKYNAYNGKK
jgi:hypothetical protein